MTKCTKHPDTELETHQIMPFMTAKWCPKCQPELNDLFSGKWRENKVSFANESKKENKL